MGEEHGRDLSGRSRRRSGDYDRQPGIYCLKGTPHCKPFGPGGGYAFFDFLNELIYFKDAEQLLLKPEKIKISDEGFKKDMSAVLAGEPLDPGRHHMHVDVKAVTLHKFDLSKDEGGWKAFVILDI